MAHVKNGWLETLPFTSSASVRERPGTVELKVARRRLGRSASLIGVRYLPYSNGRTRTWTKRPGPSGAGSSMDRFKRTSKKQAIGPGDLASDWPSKADRLWIHKAGGAHDDLIQSCPRRISCKRWSLAYSGSKNGTVVAGACRTAVCADWAVALDGQSI